MSMGIYYKNVFATNTIHYIEYSIVVNIHQI